MFYVYVLRSQTSGMRYVGQTQDLHERLTKHNQNDPNGIRFTGKNPGPWVVIYYETHPTRSEAMRREKWLKSGVGRQWLELQVAQSAESAAAD